MYFEMCNKGTTFCIFLHFCTLIIFGEKYDTIHEGSRDVILSSYLLIYASPLLSTLVRRILFQNSLNL